MKYINVRLIGGLGNQLFEYAMARSLMKNNDQLFFDTSSYKNEYYGRKFALDMYRVKGKMLQESWLERFFNPYSKIHKIVATAGLYSEIVEKGFYVHHDINTNVRTFTTLRGYWQSYKYFYRLRVQLRQEIIPKQDISTPVYLNYNETVAVHVRRTDYLNDERYNFLGEEYYIEAMGRLKSLLNKPQFIFFSDDLDWCKQNFDTEDCLFCDDKGCEQDYLQLYLMTQCKHHIISNSSFSWWGAWLCDNPEQIVIRPMQPFKDRSLLYEHYYPDKWTIIPN